MGNREGAYATMLKKVHQAEIVVGCYKRLSIAT